jgi:acyl-CoA synthetase (AMP-forming)/AMP-acid ligase II
VWTNEVSNVVGKFPQIAETNVYGVSVPHSDGRAGCAVIVLAYGAPLEDFEWKGLQRYLSGKVPRYAVPIFVRVLPGLEYIKGCIRLRVWIPRRRGMIQSTGHRLVGRITSDLGGMIGKVSRTEVSSYEIDFGDEKA